MAKKWFFDPLKPCAYDVILADPPTYFKSFTPFETDRGAQYPTMSDEWIRSLPIRDLAGADCLLMLWSTMPKLQASFGYLDACGFRYVTAGAWHKRTVSGGTSKGTGFVLQSSAEVYLIARQGKPKYRRRPQPGLIETGETAGADYEQDLQAHVPAVIDALRREHSRKPDEQYDLLEALMGDDARRCELFARQRRPGWDCWGNEVDHFGGAS